MLLAELCQQMDSVRARNGSENDDDDDADVEIFLAALEGTGEKNSMMNVGKEE